MGIFLSHIGGLGLSKVNKANYETETEENYVNLILTLICLWVFHNLSLKWSYLLADRLSNFLLGFFGILFCLSNGWTQRWVPQSLTTRCQFTTLFNWPHALEHSTALQLRSILVTHQLFHWK